MTDRSRRAVLATAGSAVAAITVAGCLGDDGDGLYEDDDAESADAMGNATSADLASLEADESAVEATALPIADPSLPLSYEPEVLREETISGGVPKDGIPSIDEPTFQPATGADSRMDDGDPVFGVEIDGEARAYPQSILVYHEIVNDDIGGESVAITYCPLTGTAMGFYRNDVEFGVSGNLVNSNLIMYDREDDSRWPQMLGTAIDGPLEGASLEEFRIHWVPWERWLEAHPDSEVLTEDTGFARDYGSDPYGAYNPRTRYYEPESEPMFQPLDEDDRHPPKRMTLGARPPEGPLAFDLEVVAEAGLVALELNDRGETNVTTGEAQGGGDAVAQFIAVYEDRLDTVHLYRGDGDPYAHEDGAIVDGDGESHAPGEVPLESVYAYDAMWFAWMGFYPNSIVVD